MNRYMKIILPLLGESRCDGRVLQEQLYRTYQELHPQDPESIREAFSQLSTVLSRLTLQENDKVWDLTCQLCYEAERQAFLEGIRVGIRLSLGEYAHPAP